MLVSLPLLSDPVNEALLMLRLLVCEVAEGAPFSVTFFAAAVSNATKNFSSHSSRQSQASTSRDSPVPPPGLFLSLLLLLLMLAPTPLSVILLPPPLLPPLLLMTLAEAEGADLSSSLLRTYWGEAACEADASVELPISSALTDDDELVDVDEDSVATL